MTTEGQLLSLAVVTILLSCGGRTTTLVLYNGADRRFGEVLRCATCDLIDLNGPVHVERHHEILVLDGHSLPPYQVLGSSLEGLMAVVAAAAPEVVVADTCYGGEIGFLRALFDASPSLVRVYASPSTLAWDEVSVPGECLVDRSTLERCLNESEMLYTYTREQVLKLSDFATAERAATRRCETTPSLIRMRPRLACLEAAGLPPALFTLEDADVCSTWAPGSVEVRDDGRCGVLGDVDAPRRPSSSIP